MERAAGLGQSAIPAIDAGDGKDALIGGGIGGRGGRTIVTDRRDDQHAALLCARYGGRQQLVVGPDQADRRHRDAALDKPAKRARDGDRSEENTSELQALMRLSSDDVWLKNKKTKNKKIQ